MALLTIALPKGRLQEVVGDLFARAGRPLPAMGARQLRGEADGIAALVVRPTDVPVYVEYGAADLGVTGRDVLLEAGRDLYEPLDLGVGRCRLAVAAAAEAVGPDGGLSSLPGARGRTLRIATKYPRVAEDHFRRTGRSAEVIRLYGNVELAPRAGLADAVVDLVDTGRTLRENGLVVVEEIVASTARLVVNRTAMKMRRAEIESLIEALRAVVPAGAAAAS